MEREEQKLPNLNLPRGFFRAVGTMALVVGFGVGASHADEIPVVRDLVKPAATALYDGLDQ